MVWKDWGWGDESSTGVYTRVFIHVDTATSSTVRPAREMHNESERRKGNGRQHMGDRR